MVRRAGSFEGDSLDVVGYDFVEDADAFLEGELDVAEAVEDLGYCFGGGGR